LHSTSQVQPAGHAIASPLQSFDGARGIRAAAGALDRALAAGAGRALPADAAARVEQARRVARERAARLAEVEAGGVAECPSVAVLHTISQESVAAHRHRARAHARVGVDVVGIVALLDALVDHTVAARREPTVREAIVGVDVVGVVALLAEIDVPVAARARCRGGGVGTAVDGGVHRVVAALGAPAVDVHVGVGGIVDAVTAVVDVVAGAGIRAAAQLRRHEVRVELLAAHGRDRHGEPRSQSWRAVQR
jgi:hypothetical protein